MYINSSSEISDITCTPYRAHHSFKPHLQPEWTHHQCYVLRSPGLSSQLEFQLVGWVLSIPVFTYAQMLHPGIPSLTHPIKQKKGLHWFMVAIFGTTFFCYMTLGIVVSSWFRGDINETASLNWVRAGVYVCTCVCMCVKGDCSVTLVCRPHRCTWFTGMEEELGIIQMPVELYV